MTDTKKSSLLATLILATLGWQYVSAQDSIESILDTYRKESDLSKKTKDESAGYLVVYTRDDLERMQVYCLTDLIKTIRFIRVDRNGLGMIDPLANQPFLYSSDLIKIFVNDHEIITSMFGSGVALYGNIDMDMFDHVEIYTGVPMLDVTTEPAAAVIKLYTKDPERENGGKLTGRLMDRGGHEAAVSHAKELEEWSYFAYLQQRRNNYPHQNHLGYDISHDESQRHLFANLNRDGHHLDLEYFFPKHDPFTAQSMQVTPTGQAWKNPFFRASYQKKWCDDTLETRLNYLHSRYDAIMESDAPIWMQTNMPQTIGPHNRIDFEVDGDVLTAQVAKNYGIGKHHFRAGLKYRYKSIDFEKFIVNGNAMPNKQAHYHIGSMYGQEQYVINPQALLTISMTLNRYLFKARQSMADRSESLTTWQGRIGYNAIWGDLSFKTFLTHTEAPTELYSQLMQHMPLDSQKYNTFSMETAYTKERATAKILFLYTQAKNSFIENSPNGDSSKHIYFQNTAFDYQYRFNKEHRLDLDIFWNHFNNISYFTNTKNFFGGYVRLLDTFGQVDLFNELVAHKGSNHVRTGYDYNAGLKYHVGRDLSVALKGTNILGKAKKSAFYTYDLVTQQSGRVILPVVDRQLYLSLEWLF